MSYDFGDIVLVPFPFTNQAASKRRPAVVVSTRGYNTAGLDVILMPVTSQPASSRPGGFTLMDWATSGLLKPSAIKPIVSTLEKRLVIRKLGSLQPLDREALSALLRTLFG